MAAKINSGCALRGPETLSSIAEDGKAAPKSVPSSAKNLRKESARTIARGGWHAPDGHSLKDGTGSSGSSSKYQNETPPIHRALTTPPLYPSHKESFQQTPDLKKRYTWAKRASRLGSNLKAWCDCVMRPRMSHTIAYNHEGVSNGFGRWMS